MGCQMLTRDLAAADSNHPYERIDGTTPVNDRYNASVGPLAGIGMPGDTSAVSVVIAARDKPQIMPRKTSTPEPKL